jgi:hypothetical protein
VIHGPKYEEKLTQKIFALFFLTIDLSSTHQNTPPSILTIVIIAQWLMVMDLVTLNG